MPSSVLPAASRSGRFRVGVGAVVVLLLAGVGVAVLVSMLSAGGSTTLVDGAGPGGGEATVAAGSGTASGDVATGGTRGGAPGERPPDVVAIFVHVLGEVVHPGLYQLRDGDRGMDAIAAAGGYTAEADRKALNLARFLSDGEQIYIPAQGAATAGGGASPGAVGGKVNINVADSAALETLPRVGPSLAARIIAWRQANGRFGAVEDLLSVSGIGEKTFAGLKDLVTI
jgi:competence protein ComEA